VVLREGGESLTPYFHAGIGARLSSHGRTGEDSELRGGGLYCVSGGVDVSLPGDMRLGLSAQYVGGIGGADDSYGFEAGIHAGTCGEQRRRHSYRPQQKVQTL